MRSSVDDDDDGGAVLTVSKIQWNNKVEQRSHFNFWPFMYSHKYVCTYPNTNKLRSAHGDLCLNATPRKSTFSLSLQKYNKFWSKISFGEKKKATT